MPICRNGCIQHSHCPHYYYCDSGTCVLKKYTHLAKHICGGDPIKTYISPKSAKEACGINQNCNCIQDIRCEDDTWTLYTGLGETSTVSKCAAIKVINCNSDFECGSDEYCHGGQCYSNYKRNAR